MRSLVISAVFSIAAAVPMPSPRRSSRRRPAPSSLHRPLDQILDVNVRDGLVYYRALKAERGRLDRYVASLNVPPATYQGWSKGQQMAFWVNAYNAFVLETVINHYPIRRSGYPASASSRSPAPSTRHRGTPPGGRSRSIRSRRRSCRSSRSRGSISRSGAAPSAAAGCAARPTPRERLEQAARPTSSRSSSTTATCTGSTALDQQRRASRRS